MMGNDVEMKSDCLLLVCVFDLGPAGWVAQWLPLISL